MSWTPPTARRESSPPRGQSAANRAKTAPHVAVHNLRSVRIDDSLVVCASRLKEIGNKLGWLGRAFHRQIARSIHSFVLCWFLLFIGAHVTMVFLTDAGANINHMFYGVNSHAAERLAVLEHE